MNGAAKINIQWFPGHMTKTRRLIEDSLRNVDLAAELLDARIPLSSRNPVVDELLGDKPRLVILNKADLADRDINKRWAAYFEERGIRALLLSCATGDGIKSFAPAAREILSDKLKRDAARGMKKAIRVMITGIPNVGKSTLINRLAGDKRAKVEDRPGVTRGKQWIHLSSGIDLLDTPGILWPKFEDERVGLMLAFTGAVKDDVIDTEAVAIRLCRLLAERFPQLIATRYKLSDPGELLNSNPLEVIGRRRGFLLPGGAVDTERASRILLDEFRAGKIGRISLEIPGGEA